MELQIIPIDWMNRYTIILGSDRATLMVLVMLSVVITLCVMGVRVGIVSHVLKEEKRKSSMSNDQSKPARINAAISDSELKVTYIHVHFVRRRCHRSLHGRSCCSLVGHVLLHLVVEAVLVLCGQVFILLLFLGSQIAPALPHDGAHLDKLDSWELSKDLGANVKGEKDKRSSRPLGCRRIPDLFDFPIDSEVFDKVALGIVSWRRDILGHLNIKTGLVLMGPRIPSGLLLRRQTLVHGTGVLGELAKGHARILPPELVAHRVLIEQIR